ncbi:UNVERIFIED_CONTAM: hypothetical protein K2H54_050601 [Gekko kuhli]
MGGARATWMGCASPPPPVPLCWAHFNPLLTEETYMLMQGPWRDSRYDLGLTEDYGFHIPGEMPGQRWVTDRAREWIDQEEDGVEIRLVALERSQQEIKCNLEEVILAIPDMVIRALRAEREEQPHGPIQPPPQAP